MPKSNDYTGQRFGRLIALRFTGKYSKTSGGNKKRIWEFQCDCGVVCEKLMEKVVRGWTKSCGCLKTTRTSLEVVQHYVFSDSYADGNLTEEQFLHLSQQPCYWCGKWNPSVRKHRYYKDITFSYHGLDRLDSNKPHDYDNCVPCCWRCNDKKSDDSESEFLDWIKSIYLNRLADGK